MKTKRLLTLMLLLIAGVSISMKAQVAVTVGAQVTDVSNIVSGKAYLLQHQGNGTNTPWIEDVGTYYNCPNSAGNCTLASVWYLIDNGDGTWKIENAYTGKYWPKPVGNANLVGTDAANAGNWELNMSSGVAAPTCNGYRLNRNTPNLVGWNSGSGSVTQVKIYEVTASTLATASPYSAFVGKDVQVSTTEAASLSEGQWYVMYNRGRQVYAYENSGSLKNNATKPSGDAVTAATYLVRPLSAGGGNFYLQNGLSNYFGVVSHNVAVPTTAVGSERYTIGKINSTNGHFYLTSKTNSVVLDCQDPGYPVVGWGTNIPTATGDNNDWAFYPVEFVESWTPTVSEVYTINNTNANRGALIYNPDASTKYVWSSGKSGTFNANNANSQWVIIPTGTEGQYYLYNVGAGKFAIPTAIAQGASNSWIFSENAVAVVFESQSDGTYKIKMASNPVSGTNAAYMAVSNNYTGPIINYNDVGGNFTITKVDGVDQSTAANAAIARLVKNQTALTSYPQTSGWYAIQIKSKTGAASYAGRYLKSAASLYNDLYPLTFTGDIDVQPAITDPTFFTYIDYTSWDVNTWKLPNGRYLVDNGSNKFPTPSATAGNVICGYDNGNYFKTNNNYYADPYNSGVNYFIGETSYMRTAYTVYPIDLAAAGLVAWQMICDNAPATQAITCTRSDVKGMTEVYKNGYFFLPTGVTPIVADFNLDGATNVVVDATNHTVTFTYDPNLAMVEGGVSVAQGWQTAGRDGEVMLLKVDVAPFKDATNVTMTVNLKDGTEANISALTLYEASTNSPEIYSTGSGAPTKTVIANATISGSTATFSIGSLSAGTHYYWIGATVSSTATLGAIIDAAVTGITYTCNDNVTNLDLTSVGDPADRGAMIFNAHSYPFLPRDNGSRVYRIPAMVVADDGSIVVAADKRYQSHTDIGGGHVIDIVVRRSTDGGKTWSEPVTIATGVGTADNSRCGYGDPSLVKGKNGTLYCLFAAGNLGYFYGQKHICMSKSYDNGVTWTSGDASNPPVDIFATEAIQNATGVGAAGGYGLYDYFVTSGKGLYTSDGILMYLIPAQTLTADNYNMTDGTYWGASSDDYLFYSTDDGETWHFSEAPMIIGGDEAKVIEMNDGSLFGSIRKGGARRFNTATYTRNNDGTLSFTYGTQWDNNQLHQDSQNNQDIIYYQRETVTGKKDVIIHSITTGQHANFELHYSTDQGLNWTKFLNVQTKGTRYVTMDMNPTNGSLYLLFEDQSLNSAGGYTDYNHYPLNFLEITREQLESLIPDLNTYAKPDYLEPKDVKIVSGTNGESTYGSWNGLTWTSNAASGVAGLTMTLSDGSHDKFSNYNSRYNMAYHPDAANTNSTLKLTAPAGYIITGYSVETGVYQGQTYTLTPESGTAITPANLGGTYTPLVVEGLNTTSTTITVTTTDATKWLCLASFTVSLAKSLALNVVGEKSYATLYLPYDVTLGDDVQANTVSVQNVGGESVAVYESIGQNVAAFTPVLLISENGVESTTATVTSGLTPTTNDNDLIGTLVAKVANNMLVLNEIEGQVGFYKLADSQSLTPFKAYLPNVSGAGAKSFILMSADEVTGIRTIDNGQLTIGNEAVYNLQGQRVATNGKALPRGIYIIGGRKVIVK